MLESLPTVNASLNFLAAVLLASGLVAVRRGRPELHRKLMLGAFSCSVLFLICYLTYHAQVGSRRFPGMGTIRGVYFLILGTHSALAAVVPFAAVLALRRALKGDFGGHKAITRWLIWVWLYVSVTGVVVYWMLYRIDWT